MELILGMQEQIRLVIKRFFLNKKLVRNAGISLLVLVVLLGIMRACFFSNNRSQTHFYLIARDINWNDFRFSGKERNVQAFAEELVLAAAKEAHLRIHFVAANSNTLLEDLKADRYDAVFTFMIPNSLNKEIYYFSDPIYSLGSVLVVNENSDVSNFEDMEGKIVGILSESSSIYDVKYYPSVIFVAYENINMALNELANGRIDGVIMDSWTAHVNTQGLYANKLKVATIPFTQQGLRLATLVNTDEVEFVKNLNDGLDRVKASGLYQKLIQKWDLY